MTMTIRHTMSFNSEDGGECGSCFGDGGAVMCYAAYAAEKVWLSNSYDQGLSHRPPEMQEYRGVLRDVLLKPEKYTDEWELLPRSQSLDQIASVLNEAARKGEVTARLNAAYHSTPAGRNVLLWDLGGERVFEVLAGAEVPWVLVDAAICVKIDPVLGTRAPLQYFWRYWVEFAARGPLLGGVSLEGGAAETELDELSRDELDEHDESDGEVRDDDASACVTPSKAKASNASKAMRRKWSESVASEPDADSIGDVEGDLLVGEPGEPTTPTTPGTPTSSRGGGSTVGVSRIASLNDVSEEEGDEEAEKGDPKV
jgi:hypothetical protein